MKRICINVYLRVNRRHPRLSLRQLAAQAIIKVIVEVAVCSCSGTGCPGVVVVVVVGRNGNACIYSKVQIDRPESTNAHTSAFV